MYELLNTYRGNFMSIVKLMLFEYRRIWKLYLALAIGILVVQLLSIWYGSYQNASFYIENARISGRSYLQIAQEYGVSFFQPFHGFPVIASIMISIAALLLYSCLIWYRDWVGKYAMAQRLFTLPITRSSLFFSKLFTIFSLVLGLIVLQFFILLAGIGLVYLTVPSEFLQTDDFSIRTIIAFNPFLSVLLPSTFTNFLLTYGAGFTFLTVLFVMILLERSFRVKGVFLGVIFASWSIALNGFGTYLSVRLHLFEREVLFILALTLVLTIIFSTLLSLFLLKRKVLV